MFTCMIQFLIFFFDFFWVVLNYDFVIRRPPHPSFPLQGRVTASPSRTDIRIEYKEIHTSEPLGSWARLAQLLTSISELYIIFERVCLSATISLFSLDYHVLDYFLTSLMRHRFCFLSHWWCWRMIRGRAANSCPPLLI